MTSQRGTALITGASMGIGRELALLFAQDKHDLVLVARSEDKLRSLAAELSSQHSIRAEVIAADLVDPSAPARIFEEVERRGLTVDALVNNAGFGSNGPFVELEPRHELEMVQVNITALLHLTRLFLPGMVARGRGRVLNIASTAGFQPGPGMATYYASKAFVLSFSEALAYELKGRGVTVTAHCPGATATEFSRRASNDRSLLFKLGAASAPSVARHAYRAMSRGRAVAVHGLLNWLTAMVVRFIPRPIVRAAAARMNSFRSA